MSTTLSAFTELRKKILFAFVAAKTLARAACIAGGRGPGPPLTPSENAMSPGPHSANPMPGTFAFASAFSSAYLSSSFRPSRSSPFGLSGQASAFSAYSSAEMPQMRAAVGLPWTPRRPPYAGNRTASTKARTAPGASAWHSRMPCTPVASTCWNIHALARTVASSVPLTGTLTMTAGVRWPLLVGPPLASPRMYSARPFTSKGACSMS